MARRELSASFVRRRFVPARQRLAAMLVGYRRSNGLTQRELAEKTNVSPGTISKIERGHRGVLTSTLDRLASVFKDISSIFDHPELDEEFQVSINEISAELIAYLNAHPHVVYDLPPRKFEELICELLRDMGCEVQLTPQTWDGGRDILAGLSTPFGRLLALVECKRFAPTRVIGPDVVKSFLWTVENQDRASCGIIATTSFFSAGAKIIQSEFNWRLKLRDYEDLKLWLAKYGNWTSHKCGTLWLPESTGEHIATAVDGA